MKQIVPKNAINEICRFGVITEEASTVNARRVTPLSRLTACGGLDLTIYVLVMVSAELD